MNKPYIPCVTIIFLIITIISLFLNSNSLVFALLTIASAILEQNQNVR